MSKRCLNIVLAVASIALGGALYVLFRDNTYVARLFDRAAVIITLREKLQPLSNNFIRFYLPDLLWGFSLACGITAINGKGRKYTVIACILSFLCGLFWELLQYCGAVNGVGDLRDVIMYLFASILCFAINFIKERKRQ